MREFDKDYYDRFYESPRTRVHGAREVARLARGVTGLLSWWRAPLRNVLDVGAGAGLWKNWFSRHYPDVRYRSIEVSAYACERYGHERRDIARWRAREKFDLIVCQGVLPYLSDEDARAAVSNMGAMARGFLYLEAITSHDLIEVCDREATDLQVHVRPGSFYRRELRPWFKPVGCGLHVVHEAPVAFYELELP